MENCLDFYNTMHANVELVVISDVYVVAGLCCTFQH